MKWWRMSNGVTESRYVKRKRGRGGIDDEREVQGGGMIVRK